MKSRYILLLKNNAKKRRYSKRAHKKTKSKANRIISAKNGISSEQNAGQEKIRAKIKIFWTGYIPAILYEFEARGDIKK